MPGKFFFQNGKYFSQFDICPVKKSITNLSFVESWIILGFGHFVVEEWLAISVVGREPEKAARDLQFKRCFIIQEDVSMTVHKNLKSLHLAEGLAVFQRDSIQTKNLHMKVSAWKVSLPFRTKLLSEGRRFEVWISLVTMFLFGHWAFNTCKSYR